MEIVGRLTADAKINETKAGAKVVNFSVATNDSFRTKSGEAKEETTYFDCSYWLAPGVATHLVKGGLVELSGRVSANAWIGTDGEAKASLQFHVDRIKLHGKPNNGGAVKDSKAPSNEESPF